MALTVWAETEAERAAKSASEDVARKCRQWLQEGLAGGPSRRHASSKCDGHWVPAKMIEDRMASEESITHTVRSWEGGGSVGGPERIVTTVQAREEWMEAPANAQQELNMEAQRSEKIWTAGDGVENYR